MWWVKVIKSNNQNLYYIVFTGSNLFYLFDFSSPYTNTPIQKSIHSTQLSPLLSLSQFQELSLLPSPVSAHEAMLTLSLVFFLFLFLIFTRAHKAEEWRMTTWWRPVSAGIRPYRSKLARIQKPKKKNDMARMCIQQHCTPHQCMLGAGGVALEPHPCFLDSRWKFDKTLNLEFKLVKENMAWLTDLDM